MLLNVPILLILSFLRMKDRREDVNSASSLFSKYLLPIEQPLNVSLLQVRVPVLSENTCFIDPRSSWMLKERHFAC